MTLQIVSRSFLFVKNGVCIVQIKNSLKAKRREVFIGMKRIKIVWLSEMLLF